MKCIFVVESKHRQCRLDAIPGKRYCGTHLPPEEGGRRRIACPINPKHSLYEDELQSHLKRCPSLKMINESRVQPYYRRDCNLGEGVDALPRARVSKGEVEPDLEGTNVAALRYAAACALGEPDFMALVRRIEAAYEEACEPPPLDDKPPSRPPERVPEPGTRVLDPKHEVQTANLVGIVERAGLLEAPEARAYVELGAGKGMLGCRLAEQVPSLGAITFVDVRSFRLNADRTLRDLPLGRVRCDIKDCWVPGLPGVRGRGWVCLGKHLCGGATDMAVRASLGDDAREDGERTAGEKRKEAHGDAASGAKAPKGGKVEGRGAAAPAEGAASARAAAAEGESAAEPAPIAAAAPPPGAAAAMGAPGGGAAAATGAPGGGAAAATGAPDAPPAATGAPGAPTAATGAPGAPPAATGAPGAPPAATGAPGAPPAATGAPGAPPAATGAPGAPPAATGAPGAPPTATGAPGAPSAAAAAPGAPSAASAPRRRPTRAPLDPSFALSLLVAPPSPSPAEPARPADGLVIASCCHHRCTWRTYVGKAFFRARGFSPLEFELVSWMTGWALCGHDTPVLDEGPDDEVPRGNDEGYEFAPHRSLTRRQRIALGTKCKRLLDAGRVDAMRRAGWTAAVKRYVDASVTGENVALTGVRTKRTAGGAPQKPETA